MEDLLYRLLEQTPLVIVLVIGIYYFTKQIEKKEIQFSKEREEKNKELKEINTYFREEAKENTETFLKLAKALEDLIDKEN